ncbi:MAG: HAD-IIIC family phosphatase [Chloroflexia bacterium]
MPPTLSLFTSTGVCPAHTYSAVKNPKSTIENPKSGRPAIKCVVWDLDNTLWPGIAAEGEVDATPEPDAGMLRIIYELEARGIVSSVASRNDPGLGERLLAHPLLAGRFVAPQVGWEPKSQAVRRIAERLNIGVDAMAFVDDSPFERAEVTYMAPEVMVLSPEEMKEAVKGPAFNPGRVTEEARRRAGMYRAEEERRAAEEGFGGSRTDFLAWCEMRLGIAHATLEDLERLAEMTERTHQLNSTGRRYSIEELEECIRSERWLVPAARLTDRFGDYGLIGAAVVDKEAPWPPGVWLAELVMLSCRVEGRGIPAALLIWLMREALDAGIHALRAVYRKDERNLPIRLLFRQLGFTTIGGDNMVLVSRDLTQPLQAYPEWLAVNGE